MKNITRRSFITKTLLTLSSSVISNSIYATPRSQLADAHDREKFQHECCIVYQEWGEKEKIDPKTFLHKAINDNVSNQLKISELTKIDFQNENFFSVNGLLLGKTEAAFLALLGSEINY